MKPIFWGENRGHFCWECYDLDMCQNSESKILIITELGAFETSFWDLKLHEC